MNLLILHTDSDFAYTAVPAGELLIFYSLDSSGKVVKRFKDSNGNFGSM
jgi:hypothetical protein